MFNLVAAGVSARAIRHFTSLSLCFGIALTANVSLAVKDESSVPQVTQAAALLNSDVQWVFMEEERGMKVFTAEVSGSDFLAVKVVAKVNAPVKSVVDALGDGSECAKWRGMCDSSRVLEVVSERERLVYMVLDLPWPVSDRDAVVRSVTEIDEATQSATVNITPASEAVPEDKYIRATTNAQFLLKVIGENEAEISYAVHAELGGDLSPGMINPRLTKATVEDVERLVALAEH